MLYEIDARLRVDENGILIAEGARDAWMSRLDEWLRTPMGSVYGLPSWGNPMEEFKHEPIGSSNNHVIEVAVEGRLTDKLREDLPGLNLQSVRCSALSADQLQITFYAQGGTLSVIMQNSLGESE
ncbi:TPA: hypothetical protein MB364_000791 [Klebsiella variicola subsp. variicola]|nr:hypothetical protein [Klebsiella variicola subsp. variicola]